MNVAIEKRPRVTTTDGSRASSWRRRNGAQAAISSGSGSRLSGGRHLTTLVMNTSSRVQPMWPSSRSSRPPARPTNGRPSRSSLKPGPSPTNMTSVSGSPSPGTAFVRVSCSRQRVQSRTSAAIASSAARRSADVTPGFRPRSAPRRPSTHPRSTRTSAIWTALVAAPLRRLSLTTQNARPRPPSMLSSWRTRPTKTSSRPGGLGGERVGRGRRVVLDDDAGHGREQRRAHGPAMIGLASSRRGPPRCGPRTPGRGRPCELTRRSGRCRILRLSVTTFHSSLV